MNSLHTIEFYHSMIASELCSTIIICMQFLPVNQKCQVFCNLRKQDLPLKINIIYNFNWQEYNLWNVSGKRGSFFSLELE